MRSTPWIRSTASACPSHFEQLSPVGTAGVLGNQGEGRRHALRASTTAASGDLEWLSGGWLEPLNMLDSLSGSDLINELAHEFAERYRRGERPPVAGIHSALSGALERDPRVVPDSGDDRANSAAASKMASGRSGSPGAESRAGAGTAWRLRILREVGRGHGRRLRGGAGESGPARRAQGALAATSVWIGTVAPIRTGGEGRGFAAPHQHCSGVRSGRARGVHYYAMQYIEGQSLDTVLAEIIRIRQSSRRPIAEPGNAPGGSQPALQRACLPAGFRLRTRPT